jgi:hypothetical protein
MVSICYTLNATSCSSGDHVANIQETVIIFNIFITKMNIDGYPVTSGVKYKVRNVFIQIYTSMLSEYIENN